MRGEWLRKNVSVHLRFAALYFLFSIKKKFFLIKRRTKFVFINQKLNQNIDVCISCRRQCNTGDRQRDCTHMLNRFVCLLLLLFTMQFLCVSRFHLYIWNCIVICERVRLWDKRGTWFRYEKLRELLIFIEHYCEAKKLIKMKC